MKAGQSVQVDIDTAFGALALRNERLPDKLLEVLALLEGVPLLCNLIKPLIIAGGWWAEERKPDRIWDVLLAIKNKLDEQGATSNRYIEREEFKDLLEETLRRISEQPDPDRRRWLREVLLKVMDQPKDHAENRLFLRLVDELSTEAHKLLTVIREPVVVPADQMAQKEVVLSKRSGVREAEIDDTLAELVRNGLVDANRLSRVATGPEGFGFFLTRLGRSFLTYRAEAP